MKKADRLPLRLALIVIGTIINAYGIDLMIHAGFGGATLAVLWQGVANQLPVTLGQASWIVAALMLLFCFFYDRRQINIGTILYQVLYGLFVDIFEGCLFYTDSVVVNFLIMILGLIILDFGVALYACADLGRGTYDGMNFALAERNNWPVGIVRSALDASVVILGVIMGGKFGLCTIVTILISGFFVQKFTKLLKEKFHLKF